MSKSPKRLGRGMSSLISAGLAENEEPGGTVDIGPPQPTVLQSRQTRSRILSIPVEKIRPNPTQPRHVFDKTGLEALAESLKDCGALQPILVRPSGTEYEVVAGERRLRAAKIAGLAEIPAIIKSIPDDRLLELALIENVQRADLNPIEHCWDQLDRAVRRRTQPGDTLHDLRRYLTEEWDNIPQARIQRLIRSMRRRCEACCASNGGFTRY